MASEAKAMFTPGPWGSKRGKLPRTVSMKRDYWEIGQLHDPNSGIALAFRSEANSRLIAAAPELYEALRLLHDNIAEYARINNLGGFNNQDMRMARAALAKAGGAA